MANEDAFTQARGCFEEMLGWLEGSESAALSHADLEAEIVRRGREAQRLAFQEHLDLRALRERRVRVVDAAHGAVEAGQRVRYFDFALGRPRPRDNRGIESRRPFGTSGWSPGC
jgi:hypothetical protein